MIIRQPTIQILISLFIVISIFFISCSSSKTANDRTANQNLSEDTGVLFKRSNLVVSDMDRSLTIYRDILEFSLFTEIEQSGQDSYSYPVFKIPKEAKIRFATLDSKSQVRTLALTEVTGYDLPKPSIPLMSALVIRVDDIDDTIQKIRNLGLETTKLKTVRSERNNFKEQAFIDYDGHLIVLYELF